jgi:hypothetical protein
MSKNLREKLTNLNVQESEMVTLSYSEGTEVFVHNETEIETALAETDVLQQFSDLLATPGLKAHTVWGNENILDVLRENELLESYQRDDTFSDFLAATLSENFYDIEFIESTVERYDHKRGFCTLSTQVQVTAGDIMRLHPYLNGWTASVKTENGTLTFDA